MRNLLTISLAIVALAWLLCVSPALAAQISYAKEQAARTCIHRRLSDLIAQDNRTDVAADASLIACTVPLRVEIKKHGKTDCEATDYIMWLIANENGKLYKLSGFPYKPNQSFITHCLKTPK